MKRVRKKKKKELEKNIRQRYFRFLRESASQTQKLRHFHGISIIFSCCFFGPHSVVCSDTIVISLPWPLHPSTETQQKKKNGISEDQGRQSYRWNGRSDFFRISSSSIFAFRSLLILFYDAIFIRSFHFFLKRRWS